MGFKTCNRCKIQKPANLEYFAKNLGSKLGLHSICRPCRNMITKKWEINNKVKRKASIASYIKLNKVKRSVYGKQFHAANREACNNAVKKWEKENRGRKYALLARRRLAKLQRTPKWLTEEQFAEIAAIYAEAQLLKSSTGEPMDVDHIVPLQGKNVSGLHVPWNLQIITAKLNRKWSNKLKYD